MPWMTATLPYALRTSERVTDAMAKLLLQPAHGNAADDETLEDDEEQQDRQDREDRHGEHRPILADPVRADEAAQRQRHGVVLHVIEIDERTQKILPGPDEGKDRGGGHGWQRQRHDDGPVDLEWRTAVNHRRLVELARQLPE